MIPAVTFDSEKNRIFNTHFTRMRFKQRSSAVLQIFLSAKGLVVVLRKVAEALRIDCSRFGSFAVFVVHLRFPAAVEPQRTAA